VWWWFVMNCFNRLIVGAVIACPSFLLIFLDLFKRASVVPGFDPCVWYVPGNIPCMTFEHYVIFGILFVIGFFVMLSSGLIPPGDVA